MKARPDIVETLLNIYYENMSEEDLKYFFREHKRKELAWLTDEELEDEYYEVTNE